MSKRNNYEQDALFPMGEVTTPQPVEPEVIQTLDRLDIMKRETGFLPTSRRELNEAFNLRTFIHEPGGAGKHLAEIARHQTRHNADAPRALLSIVAEYGTYARRARADRTSLLTLQEELTETDGLHQLSSPAGRIHTGLGQLVRYIDLSNLALNKRPSDFPFMPLRKYTDSPTPDDYVVTQPEPEVEARIAGVVGRTRAWEAERWTAAAIVDQQHRQDFWTQRLEEIDRHYSGPVRALASRALRQVGIAVPGDH